MSCLSARPLKRATELPRRWAIRNCGLMLLKALLVRLTGGNETTSRVGSQPHLRGSSSRTYESYPVLSALVLRLLRHQSSYNPHKDGVTSNNTLDTASQTIHMVFPALEIIERIGAAPSEKGIIEQLLLVHLDNPVWNLRDKVAMLLSGLVEGQVLLRNLYTLMQDALHQERVPPQNALHGRLLCLKYKILDSQNTAKGKLNSHLF